MAGSTGAVRAGARAVPEAPAGRDRPAAPSDRVATVRRQARGTLSTAVAFVVAAPVAAAGPHGTGRWLPLHLFLAGGVLLAISAASQLFAVTWAAGPPPSRRLAVTQRVLVAAGAAGTALAREAGAPAGVTVAAGSAVVAGLALLAWSLVRTVRGGVQRRFDVTLGWYLCALGFGLAGVSAGVALAAGAVPAHLAGRVRETHVLLNALGLVGVVVAGTLPFFVATQAKMRMSPRRNRQRLPLGAMAGGVTLAAAGVLGATPPVAGLGLACYLAGLGTLARILPRPGRRQLAWAGPRLVQLGCGLAWWAATVAAVAGLAGAGRPLFPPAVLFGLVLGGYAQILAASLAYLGPVLRAGGWERLSRGFATTASWPAVVAGNLAAAGAVAGWEAVAVAAVGWWTTDLAVREVRRRLGP